MNVVINGERTDVSPHTSIAAILTKYDLPKAHVVELNREIVAPEAYDSTVLEEGDTMEIIRFVGGG